MPTNHLQLLFGINGAISLGQPLGWFILVVYAILFTEPLYIDYLDHKEKSR